MVGEKRKKTIMFIGSMIVALMFVTSYLAFGNNNSGVSTTTYTTTIKGSTLVVSGETNATIVNYTPNFRITLNNASCCFLRAPCSLSNRSIVDAIA